MAKIKVKFHCGCYTRPWLGVFEEPPECHNSGEIDVDAEDWEDGCVEYTCEVCKNELYQGDDHFEKVSQ